ncbi:MAG: PEP-CTERM sorting domain-containing protein [Pirellulales bacterium]|nr:PEP-CTERM sorting domain-containing protein [Pirellulales bacterium]
MFVAAWLARFAPGVAGRFAGRTILIGVLWTAFAAASPGADQQQPLAYASWTATSGNTHVSPLGAVRGSMLFSTAGDDIVYSRAFNATDAGFVEKFAASMPAMWFENGAANSAADALVQLAFTPALPAGARLIVIDVDIANRNEQVQISTLGGTLALLEQLETQQGAASRFPRWNPASGVLSAVGGSREDASVFDVSGARSLALWYTRAGGGSGVTGSHFVVAVPVPEPGSLLGLAAGWAGVVACARRRVRPPA